MAEEGTHDQLMKERGLYHSLVTAQFSEDDDDEEKEMDDVIEDLSIGTSQKLLGVVGVCIYRTCL